MKHLGANLAKWAIVKLCVLIVLRLVYPTHVNQDFDHPLARLAHAAHL